MAIDTRDKRASSHGIALDFMAVRPVPDGSINAADRLHLNWMYRGIAAAAPVVPAAIRIYTKKSDLFARTRNRPTAKSNRLTRKLF